LTILLSCLAVLRLLSASCCASNLFWRACHLLFDEKIRPFDCINFVVLSYNSSTVTCLW
jgi:hypothetical protein